MRAWIVFWTIWVPAVSCFIGRTVPSVRMHPRAQGGSNLNMVFDFLRQRAQEGIAQVKNIAEKTKEGKLLEALEESADYVRKRNQIVTENFQKLLSGLSVSRLRLLGGISEAFQETNASVEKKLEKLEETLLQADIGYVTTTTIIEDLRSYARTESLSEDDILPVLRERLIEALTEKQLDTSLKMSEKKPTVLFVMGANGMGKTTTIGKVAARLRREWNATVLLAACDVFRAAADEQLQHWADRAEVDIEMPLELERGGVGSPIPVLQRALQRAVDSQYDVLIVDTSGRLSNNYEATEQLQDMKKVIAQVIPGAPHETLLVVDGSVGRSAVDQAKIWREEVGLTGLVVTKMDGTARGGFIVSVVRDLGIPVKFIGVGERVEDLRDFQAETYVDALLGVGEEAREDLRQKAGRIIKDRKFLKTSNDKQVDSLARLREQLGQQGKPQQSPLIGNNMSGVVDSKSKESKRSKSNSKNASQSKASQGGKKARKK